MKEKCNGLGNTATYSLSEGAGTTNGVFYSGEDGGDFFTPDYVAIYPTATVRPFRFFVKGVAQVKDAMKHVSRQVSDVDNVDLSGKKMFFFKICFDSMAESPSYSNRTGILRTVSRKIS